MTYLFIITATLALLGGFVALTMSETARGTRVFGVMRSRFDVQAERIAFIMAHVDFGAFLRDEIQHALARFGHATATLSLNTVRAAERLLTRVVRHMRQEHAESIAPRESAREFVKTLANFKDTINATHPEVSDKE